MARYTKVNSEYLKLLNCKFSCIYPQYQRIYQQLLNIKKSRFVRIENRDFECLSNEFFVLSKYFFTGAAHQHFRHLRIQPSDLLPVRNRQNPSSNRSRSRLPAALRRKSGRLQNPLTASISLTLIIFFVLYAVNRIPKSNK